MRIINKTHWRTDHLRTFLSRVAKDELSAEKRKRLCVTVSYTRRKGGCSSGYAWIGGSGCFVRIARHEPDMRDFCMVAAHEFAHLRGLNHRDTAMFKNPHYHRVGNWRQIYAWAEGIAIGRKPPRPKLVLEPTEKIQAKLIHARRAVERWQKKVKRASTWLKKYQRRVRYYEKKAAACASGGKGGES